MDIVESQLPSLYGNLLNTATSGGVDYWLNLGIGLILSTIIGGLVLFIILAAAGREWHEGIHPLRAFFVVLIINIITMFGILNIFGTGAITLVLPVLVWIILLKLFFMEMALKHVLILSVISYIASLLIVPFLVGFVQGFISF